MHERSGGLCAQVYCQPIYEFCDKTFGNILAPTWCLKNTVVRLVCRTVFICLATLVRPTPSHRLVSAVSALQTMHPHPCSQPECWKTPVLWQSW